MPLKPVSGKIESQEINDNFSYLETEIYKNVSGTPKAVFDTLNQLKAAYPNGTDGVFLVLETGHIYFWKNTSWEDAGPYQAVEIGDKTVTPKKVNTDLLNRVHSLNIKKKIKAESLFDTPQSNLFNMETVTNGFYLINGIPTPTSAGNCYSDYIPITPNQTYWITRILTTDGGEFCDENFNFIQKIIGDGTSVLVVPSGAYYMRLNISTSNSPLNSFMVVEGSTAPVNYIDHHVGEIKGLKVESDHLVGFMYPEQFGDVEILNLFDKTTATPNKGVSDTTGALIDSPGVYASRFIRVNPGDVIGCTNKFTSPGGFYTIEKTWVGKINFTESETGWYTATVPIGVYFVRVNATQSTLNTYMLTKSATKPKFYSPYQVKLRWLKVEDSASSLNGTRILAIGDSLTWLDGNTTPGYDNGNTVVIGYQEQFRKAGAIVTSKGHSGATYRQYDPSISNMEHGSLFDDIVTNGFDVAPYDIYLLCGGTNDVARGYNPGTVKDYGSENDPKTTLDAFRGIIEYIFSANPNALIYVFTPPFSTTQSRPKSTMLDITDKLVEQANNLGVFAKDTYRTMGMNVGNINTLTYDQLHFNNVGFEKWGKWMVKAVESN